MGGQQAILRRPPKAEIHTEKRRIQPEADEKVSGGILKSKTARIK